MAIEQKTVQYAKEVDDVLVLIVELVKDIKAKKEFSVIAGENLQNLMNAIASVDQVDDEVKASMEVTLQTAGFRLGELTAAIVSPTPVAPAPAA